MKPPRGPANVPWHQDASPFNIVTASGETTNPLLFDYWLGLDAGTRANGCLKLVPNSQKLGRVEHRSKGGILSEAVPAEHGFTEDDIVAIETESGDMIVWHQDMFHGSDPNTTDEQRIGKASVYMGGREEQVVRSWFSVNHPTPATHRYRLPIALNGQPMPLDMPLPPPVGQ